LADKIWPRVRPGLALATRNWLGRQMRPRNFAGRAEIASTPRSHCAGVFCAFGQGRARPFCSILYYEANAWRMRPRGVSLKTKTPRPLAACKTVCGPERPGLVDKPPAIPNPRAMQGAMSLHRKQRRCPAHRPICRATRLVVAGAACAGAGFEAGVLAQIARWPRRMATVYFGSSPRANCNARVRWEGWRRCWIARRVRCVLVRPGAGGRRKHPDRGLLTAENDLDRRLAEELARGLFGCLRCPRVRVRGGYGGRRAVGGGLGGYSD